LTRRRFELGRPLVLAYAGLSLASSAVLVLLSLRRGPGELGIWLAAWLLTGLVSMRAPDKAPLLAGFLAFALGFVRTWRHGPNLDLGLGLVTLAVGLWMLDRARRGRRPLTTDVGGLALLAISVFSLVSLVFAVARIRSFAPAPGFSYHVYRFNPLGLSSEEAVLRVILGAAGAFSWFGIHAWARAATPSRRGLAAAVLVALSIDGAALLVQRHVDPGFLLPVGMPPSDRLNGVTSWCYALGDVLLALFLLLPAWGSTARVLPGALTLVSLALLGHAVVASGSRSALLTMAFSSLLWAGARLARIPMPRRRLALAAAVAALVVVAAGAAYRATVPDQATPLGRLKTGVEREGLLGHLYATRLSSYPLIYRVLEAHPLSGVGVGLYPAEVDRQRALLAPELDIEDLFLLTSNAPNQFLHAGVELGLPALAALLVAFLHGGWRAWRRWQGGGSGDELVALVALALALQFGPGLLNSEAMVFLWLVVARAAGPVPGEAGEAGEADEADPDRPVPPRRGARATAGLVAAALALGVAGQWLARPALAVEAQWKRLRWRLNIGLQPPEPGGQWTGPEATFVVDAQAPALVVRWHTGDRAAPEYRPEVVFYVDGVARERSIALPGRIRESRLPLPPAAGFKRISVRVVPPFVPAERLGGSDRRPLGVFIHSLTPVADAAASR
jgi:O-antigen ligase